MSQSKGMESTSEGTIRRDDQRSLKDPASIRRMFADIAPTYDFLNHFLSANLDRSWRRAAIRMADLHPGNLLLDVCTGTGDLAFEASRQLQKAGGGGVIATDFCTQMVKLAKRKDRRRGGDVSGDLQTASDRISPRRSTVALGVADTLQLPFREGVFDAVTVGFGIRNVGHLGTGLGEMHRLLKTGGRAVLLEFTTPRSAMVQRLFGFYFNRLLPRLGRWLSAAPDPNRDNAYQYLPDSVASFPHPERLKEIMEQSGFSGVRYKRMTCGIVAVHVGIK